MCVRRVKKSVKKLSTSKNAPTRVLVLTRIGYERCFLCDSHSVVSVRSHSKASKTLLGC